MVVFVPVLSLSLRANFNCRTLKTYNNVRMSILGCDCNFSDGDYVKALHSILGGTRKSIHLLSNSF